MRLVRSNSFFQRWKKESRGRLYMYAFIFFENLHPKVKNCLKKMKENDIPLEYSYPPFIFDFFLKRGYAIRPKFLWPLYIIFPSMTFCLELARLVIVYLLEYEIFETARVIYAMIAFALFLSLYFHFAIHAGIKRRMKINSWNDF